MMSYKNITILNEIDNGGGVLERVQAAIEPCAAANTGWGIMTPGNPIPINDGEREQLINWGDLDGPAIIHGRSRIPVAAIPIGDDCQ